MRQSNSQSKTRNKRMQVSKTTNRLERFKPSRSQIVGGALMLSAGMLALAAVPNIFSSGSTISSTAVNDNFSALDTRTGTLEGVNAASRLGTLETTVTGGNIVLVNSTASTGNIMKGNIPFLHNFGLNNSSTFLGLYAGNFTMTGTNNTGTGYLALAANTSGMDNTASGLNALRSNTTGSSNVAYGVSALFGNTGGNGNTAIGVFALESATGSTGSNNTASGYNALRSNTGSNNTAAGAGALSNNTTGGANIAVGLNAGLGITTGSSNIAIGNAGGSESNTIRLGNATDHTRAFIAGIRGITTGVANAVAVVVDSNGQLGTVSSSQRVKDHITDMGEASSTLMKLRPVTFYYKADQNPKGRSLQYGLVAEEVEKVAPGLVARSANGEIETVFYQYLTPMLLNEYQKQQRLIETQTAALAKQTDRVAELEQERRLQTARIESLEQLAARMAVVLGRLERAGMLATAGR